MTQEAAGSNDHSRKLEALDMAHSYANMFASVPMMASEELFQLLHGGERNSVDYLVDVRDPDEQTVSIIPSAMTKAEFEEKLRSLAPPAKDSHIVVYCTIGYRSGVYATYLKDKLGYRNVHNNEGIVLYTHVPGAELVQVAANGRHSACTVVHTYGATWSLASERFDTVQFGLLSSLSASLFQAILGIFYHQRKHN